MDTSSLERAFFAATQRLKRLHMIDVLGTMPRGEFFVMDVLARNGAMAPHAMGMYVSDLATRTHMSPQSASRTLRAMEAKGMIERATDPRNRRSVFIRLTPDGAAAWEAKHTAMRAYMSRVVARMGEADMQCLIDLLARLADTIETDMETEGAEPNTSQEV